jgi:hypothetical protein
MIEKLDEGWITGKSKAYPDFDLLTGGGLVSRKGFPSEG